MTTGPFQCGHHEDPKKNIPFNKPGELKPEYRHRECVEGHVLHTMPSGVSPPKATGRIPAPRIEEFCPICLRNR